MSPLVDGTSYWTDTTPGIDAPALADDVDVDCCVVGAGITGLLTAWALLERGRDVVVLEQREVAGAVSGYTTGKLTAQHGLRYSALVRQHGNEAAAWYAAANQRACEWIDSLARAEGIAADLERRDALVYAGSAGEMALLHQEATVARRAGLAADIVADAGLPYATHGAVRLPNQLQLHPRRLLVGLASRLVARGCPIHQHTRVVGVSEPAADGRMTVATGGGPRVTARDVVLATLLPTPLGHGLRRHLYCHQGYAVACPVDGDPIPHGMFISAGRPMRSLRTIRTASGERLLQVGGSAYVDDPSSGATPWDDLESWAHGAFAAHGIRPAGWRWSTQDYSSTDGVPLIGPLHTGSHVHVATGFGGWGLSSAGVAAELVSSQVAGETADWHALYDPARGRPEVSTRIVSAHRAGGGPEPGPTLDALPPGSSLVLDIDGEEVAVHRDRDGALHRVSAVCTHLDGILLWDAEHGEWSCPCHGSRFRPDGSVTNGPASTPLPRR